MACTKTLSGTFPSESSGSNFTSTSDSFDRLDNVNNPGSMTDALLGGTPWPFTVALGTFGIASNHLYINAVDPGTTAAFLGLDPGKSGCDIEVTFGTLAAASQSAIIFRTAPSGQQFAVFIDKNGVTPGHYLMKFPVGGLGPAGVDDELVTAPVDGETIRIEQSGSTINVFLVPNPVPIMTATDSDFINQTGIAIGSIANDTTTTIDSWIIEDCD